GGMLMTLEAFLILLIIIIRKLVFGDAVAGWASTICIIIFIGGVQLFCLGIMGQYIAKTYLETKRRPHCIIAETNREDVEKIL
ncbi:MAG: glycosyltransferase, partial [Oscillospiraceae bacterium]|nr:glycosyltransferase [Oscillospiraceae bacterium]